LLVVGRHGLELLLRGHRPRLGLLGGLDQHHHSHRWNLLVRFGSLPVRRANGPDLDTGRLWYASRRSRPIHRVPFALETGAAAGACGGWRRPRPQPSTRAAGSVSTSAAGRAMATPRPWRTAGSRVLIRTSAPLAALESSGSRRTVGTAAPGPMALTGGGPPAACGSRRRAGWARSCSAARSGTRSASPNVRVWGRAREPQAGQEGRGGRARIVSGSTSTVTSSAGHG